MHSSPPVTQGPGVEGNGGALCPGEAKNLPKSKTAQFSQKKILAEEVSIPRQSRGL